MPLVKETQRLLVELESKTDEELIFETLRWVPESEAHAAAQMLLHRRREKLANSRHSWVLGWAVAAAVISGVALVLQVVSIATTEAKPPQPTSPQPAQAPPKP